MSSSPFIVSENNSKTFRFFLKRSADGGDDYGYVSHRRQEETEVFQLFRLHEHIEYAVVGYRKQKKRYGAAVAQIFYESAQFVIWATVIATVVMFIEMMKHETEDLKKHKTEAARLDTELSTAAHIQEDMLPRTFPAFPDRKEFDIYASMKPAKEVGGDFYTNFSSATYT